MNPDEQHLPTEPDVSEGIVPTPEELEEYVRKLEAESADPEEQRLALQAQADLAEGKRQVERQQRAKVRALRRTFRGIHSRPQIITLATVGLLRTARAQNEAIDNAKEQS